MTAEFETWRPLKQFDGTAPTLLQPHMVMFPGSSQIVSVRENVVRRMVSAALNRRRLIAVALATPTIGDRTVRSHDVVCLAQINHPHQLTPADGHIHLTGLVRARLVAPAQGSNAARTHQLELLHDHYAAAPQIDRRHRTAELLSLLRQLFPHVEQNELFQFWSDTEHQLGTVCDLIAEMMGIDPQWKQELLAEVDVDLRSDLLLVRMRELVRRQRDHVMLSPSLPLFSTN